MRMLVLLAAVCAAAALPLAAQSGGVAPGDLIRFSPGPGGAYTVLEAHADSLVVLDRNHSELSVPLRGVVVRRSRGLARGSSFARGLLYGAAAGAAVGAIDAVVQGGDPPDEFGLGGESVAEKARFEAVLLGFGGAVAGGVVGLVKPARRWEVVSEAPGRASLSPTTPDGRPGLVLSVRF